MPNPNRMKPLFNGGSQSASGDFSSDPIDTSGLDRLFIALRTADAMTGVLKIQASLTPLDLTSWGDLEDVDQSVDGVKTIYNWNLAELGMRFIRINFTHSGGTGVFAGDYNEVDDR